MTVQLNSVRRLKTIALALGEARTRAELVPFLADAGRDDEDEVLQAVAEQLGDFVPLVGGPAYAHVLLPPLEAVSTVEETVVRDSAVAALCKVAAAMGEADAAAHFLPLVKARAGRGPATGGGRRGGGRGQTLLRLPSSLAPNIQTTPPESKPQRLACAEFWTARVSSAGLFAACYARCPGAGAELRGLFGALARDDTPMVRRAAAQQLGVFGAAVAGPSGDGPLAEVLAVFSELAGDEQDSVRLLSVEAAASLAKLLPPDGCATHLLPAVNRFGSDKSWRVRYAVAAQLVELARGLGPAAARDHLLPAYLRLLRDGEAEVRIAAAGRVAAVAGVLGGSGGGADGAAASAAAAALLLPCVRDLAADANPHVRAALAGVVAAAAPALGRAATVEGLLPTFLALLKDDSPDVRLNIIATLGGLTAVVGADLVSTSLLPAVVEARALNASSLHLSSLFIPPPPRPFPFLLLLFLSWPRTGTGGCGWPSSSTCRRSPPSWAPPFSTPNSPPSASPGSSTACTPSATPRPPTCAAWRPRSGRSGPPRTWCPKF